MPVYIQEAKPLLVGGSVYQKMKHPDHRAAPALLSNKNFKPQHDHRLAPLEMTASQSSFINATMKNLRQNELAKESSAKKKRQKLLHHHDKQLHETRTNRFNRSGKDWASIFLDQLSRNESNVAQIVATNGGLVTYWNETFAEIITRSTTSLRTYPITMFELIEPKSLPSLYGMLALALHDVSIVEEEEEIDSEEEEEQQQKKHSTSGSSSSHLSITLPCKSFCESSCRYNITIIFMNDLSSRCFVGILTRVPEKKNVLVTQPCADSCQMEHCKIRDDSLLLDLLESQEVSSSESSSDGSEHEEGGMKTLDQEVVESGKTQVHHHEPHLPCGKMLRLYDDVLCQMIFGYE